MQESRASPRWRNCLVLLACFFTGTPSFADASVDASSRVDAAESGGQDAGAFPDADAYSAAASLHRTTVQIQAFLDGQLDVEVEPARLFEAPIDDDEAVDVEAARLAAMLRQIDDAARNGSKGARSARTSRQQPTLFDGGVYGEGRSVDPDLWAARVELDRARLQFLGLPKVRREELLATHAERTTAAARARAERSLSDAERATEARLEDQRVLEEARLARAEAEHRVAEEYNRLLEIGKAQTAFEAALVRQRKDLTERGDIALGWHRRAAEARTRRGGTPADVDDTYDDLRRTLRNARGELATALDEVSEPSRVPSAGSDPLAELHVDVDVEMARKERKAVETEARRLREQERQFRDDRVTKLLDEIHELNQERLGLQPFLSGEKRDAITGFGAAGIDQAAAEIRQLALVLRFHRHATGNWLASLRLPGQALGSVGRGALVLFQWLLAVGVFAAWRRRASSILANLRARAEEADREARRSEPTAGVQLASFLQQVHGPLEWLVLLAVLGWLMPGEARQLLEVQLLIVIFSWTLIGSFVVNALNALAGAGALRASHSAVHDSSALRLRSLRLVGRVVVVLGLVLVMSARLVGKGTLYQWVWSTCWVASIPIFLVLVRWWRETVFARMERARKKTALENWLVAHRTGWKSFPAAMVGGVYLFVYGAWRAARGWVGRFDVTRRVLAYLFRRELDKLVEEQSLLQLEPLPGPLFQALGPDQLSQDWVSTQIDDRLDRLVARLQERRGGLIALIGERGMGKTHLLQRVHERIADVVHVNVATADASDFSRALFEHVKLPYDTVLLPAAEVLGRGHHGPAILVDGAEHFVRPAMGGLALFDEVIAAARQSSAQFTWVLAFDDVIWQFLKRARGARPVFDEVIHLEPWREEEITQLLQRRTVREGAKANFELLLDRLPANADEFDKQEALAQREASYYRLIWDHAGGNPGVALDTWRRSLGTDAKEGTYVKLLQALDSRDLEMLPDSAILVLRAVLQLSPALADAICNATMLRKADVDDALRYAVARGYVTGSTGGYVVSWTWFRPLTRFLQRRHLLVVQ
jgi:hypothetical protein